MNPYVGLGLDLASAICLALNANDTYYNGYPTTDFFYDNPYIIDGTRPILLVRAGLEIYHHFRIESTVYVGGRYANGFSLSLGFVVGGRPKKFPY